jgi:gliding motility-associated-like protein
MFLTITPAPSVNAGADQTVCANNANVTLNGTITVSTGAVWTTSGNGVFTPNATTLNAVYAASPADIAGGTVTLTLTTTGNGLCNAVSDQMNITITPAPAVNAGADQTICAAGENAALNGSVSIAAGGMWSTSGSGIFSPAPNILNASYTPSAADTAAHTVTLTLTTTGNGNCLPVSDDLILSIRPVPIVNAGPDTTVCGTVEFVTLSGSVVNAAGLTWSSSGAGFFSPDNSASTVQYLPSGTELSGGTVTITLTSSGSGSCAPVTDQMQITILPIPAANAGPDQTVCANNALVQLNGSVTNAAGGTWISGGDGTFSDENILNPVYTPSSDDISSGSVTLTLFTTGTGVCNPVSDQMTLTFSPAPAVNAGPDQSVCANNPTATLNGTVTIASGAVWTTSGSGIFSPSANTLNATYTPSNADTAAGSVTLTLTSTGNGNCLAETDNMILTISDAPAVNPGSNQTVCANTAGVTLNGSVIVAGGGTWTTASGTGTFLPDANTLNAVFIPSPLQIGNGQAILTLTSNNNGNCNAVSANMVITLQAAPSANAGPDVEVCTGTANIILNGTVSNAAGGSWTTSGSGNFIPSSSALNASYQPDPAENFDGSVITLTLSTTGNGVCPPAADQMTISFETIPVNAGPDQTVCSNSFPVQLNGLGSGSWSGGTGTFSDPNSLSTSYTPALGEVPGVVTLTLTGVAVGNCIPGSDDVQITLLNGPAVNAGADQTICANNPVVSLNGTVNFAGGGTWTTEGSGTFTNANSLNTTYTASAADITAGSVRITLTSTGNGICNPASDTLLISFSPAPLVNAGTDQAACENSGPVTLNGSLTIAPGGIWSIVNGNGSIANPALLNTSYTPDPSDITAGSVTLRLTSNAVGNCNPVTDEMIITFGNAPAANAGPDQTVCGDVLSVNLNGSVINAGGGQWTSNGSGTFTPNAFALSASYVPSAADTSAGSVILTLTTTGNGNCLPVQDQMIITITDVPSANAGADQTLCADVISVSLSGSVSTATGGLWSTSGTGTFSNANSLNTSYTPSAAEKNAGSVLLTLTTTGNGTCNSYSNNVTLFFTPAPTVNAGLDQTGCVDVASYNISAGATVATGIIWTSSGSGVFGNVNAFNTTYTPSAADKLLPSVTLTATTSSGTGTCNPVSDEMIISFTGAPTVNAGSDRNVCADKDSINLSAAFTVASGATWTSSGSGTFTNPSDPNTAYFFSSADKAGSSVTLTLTTNGNGTCNAATDDLVVTIAPFPIVNAGADQTICSGQANATLNGTMLNAVGGIWTSSGTGSFSDANALNTTYFPTQQDFDLGGIILTLTSTGNGNCNAVSDFVVVNVIPSPAAIVNAGMDQSVCADVAEVKLTGFISNAGGGVWSSPGTGTFIPNVNSLEAAYRPSAADKALGSITLTLTTVNNGICSPVTDDMTITFTPAPTVNAGPDLTICGDLAGAANLNGSFTVATGAIWSSSGTGVFVPNEATMAATYIPSASDKNTGTVGLTLTTTGNGTCQSVSDFMLLRITSPPTANAGPDQTVCENVSSVILNGSVTIATGGSWTTSGSGNFTNTNSLVTMYNPSANDINSGAINLTLTTTGNGSCTPVTDQVRITFQTVPVVSAGSNQTICANTSAQLNGTVSGASGVVWTTAGTGVFSSVNALNPIYSPSQQDISAGSVILTLTSTGNGQCPPATDQTRINLQPAPSVNAGLAVSCDPVSGVPLSGSVSNASGGKWSTSGTGVFFPSPASVITAYFPSQPDVSSGSVTLTLTSTGNGVCPETSHSIPLNFQNTPAADAGADEYVCPGSSITLSAQTFPNITYNWTNLSGTSLGTNADLTFNVNTDTTLVLTITDQRGCQSTDTVNINLFTLPGLSLDPAYCLDNSLILIPGQSPLPTVPGTYQWFINGSIITGSNAPVLSPVKPGIYRIVFSYGNCFSDASTNVTGPPELTSEFIMDCEGNATDITITSNVNGVNYTWSTGQSGMDLNTISITVLQDTTYYRATVTDALGCSSRDSVRVIGIPVPLINLSDISSCEGEIEVLAGRPLNIVNLDSLYPDYTWFRNTIQIADKNDSLSINASGQYVLQLVIGQCTVTDTAQADFHVNPAASLPDYAKFCALTDNYIIIDAGGDPGAGDTYLWTAPAGITLDSNNTKTTGIRREGKYYVLVKNIFNCSTTDSIFADDLCPPLLDVPTGFIPGSPGPDGTFRVFGNYFRNFRLLIFNRWGEVIFMSTDKNEGWDGTYRGELMPVGVYPWVVTYEGEDEEYKGPHRKEGSVTLVR